ncbi:MAG: transporter [Verrucomicrobiota bacterium]
MPIKFHHLLSVTWWVAATHLVAGAPGEDSPRIGSAPPDKSSYTLFNPTPVALLRDFATDRPNKTNGPRTLDAGHAQVEMDLGAYACDKQSGSRTENWTVANTNLRLGLTHWAELQLLVPFYQEIHTQDTTLHPSQITAGSGDLSVGLKMNFWGNDTGNSAGGLAAYVKTPTASHEIGNGKTEGSVLGLLDFALPADFDLGINGGVGITANDDHGYHADFIASACVAHKLVGSLSGYLEFYSSVPSNQSNDWVGTVDVGVTLMVAKNVQLDTGLNIGVTHAADDLQTFLGLSVRF